MIEYLDAQDEIFGVANTAFIAAIEPLALDYQPALHFPGEVFVPDTTLIYATCDFVVVLEQQTSLANVGGTKLYESKGLFTLQVYAPKSDIESLRRAETIASAVRDAFRKPSPSGEVWFTNQRATKVSGNETCNQVNVVVTATYKTAK